MSFAHYLLQVNLYLIVFYGAYKLLLDKETYFTLNRIYLVGAGVLSLCIPFIRLEWLTEQKAAQQVYTTVNWDAVLQQATVVTETKAGINWANLLVYIYAAGILFFVFRLVINLFKVNRLIQNVGTGSAFSFLSKKVLDLNLPSSDVIDIHEQAHIKQWHTVDILFFELIGILTWLNPVIYFYKKTIKNIHEYLADEQAAEFQGDKAEYAMLILSKSFGINPNSLTNGFFNKSLIKKRIYMLQKERSKKTAILKYGIFIPLFAILILFSSATIRKNENLMALAEEIPIEEPISLVQQMVTKPIEFNYSEKASSTTKNKLDHNWKDFYKFLSNSIKYPKEAQEHSTSGYSKVKFSIKDGRISIIKISSELGDGCNEEVLRVIKAYKNFNKISNGKYAMRVAFHFPDVKLEQNKPEEVDGYHHLPDLLVTGYSQVTNTRQADRKVYDFVSIEKQPEYEGGIKKFYDYLSRAIKYPVEAQDNNIQGKVYLSFTVETDGSLSDVQVTRGLGYGMDEEAVRVLRESPKWNPGIQDGNPVRVKYNINVNFTLNSDPPKNTGKTVLYLNKAADSKKGLYLKGSNSDLDNQPLVIVDGITQSKDALKFLPSNNIESVSVLKDASAVALYGTKAINGAILIITKKTKSPLFKTYDQDNAFEDK